MFLVKNKVREIKKKILTWPNIWATPFQKCHRKVQMWWNTEGKSCWPKQCPAEISILVRSLKHGSRSRSLDTFSIRCPVTPGEHAALSTHFLSGLGFEDGISNSTHHPVLSKVHHLHGLEIEVDRHEEGKSNWKPKESWWINEQCEPWCKSVGVCLFHMPFLEGWLWEGLIPRTTF